MLELVRGHDDKVRSVKLKRGDGVVTHPSINHLCPLELSLTHNPHFQNSDLTQTSSDVIPREIIPDTSSGNDSVTRNQTASGGDSLNQGQTASDDLSPSRQTNSVDSSRPSRAAVVAGRERVKLWARKLNMS